MASLINTADWQISTLQTQGSLIMNTETGLPYIKELSHSSSVCTLAERLYPGVTFDYALPQPWVDECKNKGFDVLGQCVWIYPDSGSLFGEPGALTQEFYDWFTATFDDILYTPQSNRE